MIRLCLTIAILILLASSTRADGEKKGTPKNGSSAPAQPYTDKTDPRADLKKAIARAKQYNRRVLIQWGGNWCPWCIVLHRSFMTDPEMKRELANEYEFVLIDIGRRERNMDLAKEYKAVLSDGIPYLTVLDGAGKVLANQRTDGWEIRGANGQRRHDRDRVLAFLRQPTEKK